MQVSTAAVTNDRKLGDLKCLRAEVSNRAQRAGIEEWAALRSLLRVRGTLGFLAFSALCSRLMVRPPPWTIWDHVTYSQVLGIARGHLWGAINWMKIREI